MKKYVSKKRENPKKFTLSPVTFKMEISLIMIKKIGWNGKG